MSALDIQRLSVSFNGVAALTDVSFSVAPGRIVGIIGANGAGKTTLLNCISRFYTPTRGTLSFEGANLLRLGPHQLIRRGITRTFQHLELFAGMTALENLLVGQVSLARSGILRSALRTPLFRREDKALRQRAREMLRMLDLAEYEDWPVGALSYGVRKRLDLGRAFVTRPRLVLLDEPASGTTHQETERLMALVRKLRDQNGASILLVEHNMGVVMKTCERVVVLDFGQVLAQGTPEEIRRDPAVIQAYLGSERGSAREERSA